MCVCVYYYWQKYLLTLVASFCEQFISSYISSIADVLPNEL